MTPTWHEKYLKGMEMERAGSGSEEIAAALGFKDKRGWYNTKAYFKNKALTERAAMQPSEQPEPAAILEGLSCVDKVHGPVKPATNLAQSIKADMHQAMGIVNVSQAEQAKELKTEPVQEKPAAEASRELLIKRELTAQGEKLQYRCFDGKIAIKQLGVHGRAITLTRNDVVVMMMELHELIMETTT